MVTGVVPLKRHSCKTTRAKPLVQSHSWLCLRCFWLVKARMRVKIFSQELYVAKNCMCVNPPDQPPRVGAFKSQEHERHERRNPQP